MSAEPRALELQGIVKVFGGLKAINQVSFVVERGSIFGLIGPNGAGKTTIFNVITGVYTPDQGSVLFEGRSIGGMGLSAIALMGIARTFQNIRLFGEMSVVENVVIAGHHLRESNVLGAMLRTARHAADEKRLYAKAEELLDIFGLRELKHEEARSLPYGAQRRLEIARALMLGPRLILLDEPAAGMNSQEADTLKDQIRWLRDRFDLTVVLVEHNMHVVMNVCDVVHCVDHGESIAAGTPDVVQNHPAVRAAYLGEEDA